MLALTALLATLSVLLPASAIMGHGPADLTSYRSVYHTKREMGHGPANVDPYRCVYHTKRDMEDDHMEPDTSVYHTRRHEEGDLDPDTSVYHTKRDMEDGHMGPDTSVYHTKREPASDLAERWTNYGTDNTHRVVTYMAYFHVNQNTGPYTPLLPILDDHSGITDVLLFVCDLHQNAPHLTVGGQAPTNTTFLGPLWSEVAKLQAGGINVAASFGGFGSNTFLLLQQDFKYYYPILHDFLRSYNLSGVDFDVEPSLGTLDEYASGESILKLVKQIRQDFGPDFLISMAPVAVDLTNNPALFSGFDYTIFDSLAVDDQGNKIVDFYNCQFYSGFGNCNSTDTYDQIVSNGFDPSRVVMLCPADSNDAQPWYPIGTVEATASALAQNYSNFGGVGGYEYVFSGTSDNITRIQWYKDVASAIGA